MTRLILPALVIVLLAGCLSKQTSDRVLQDSTTRVDSLPAQHALAADSSNQAGDAEYEMSECVFDSSTYKFTTDALRRYKTDIRYRWNKQTAEATTVLDNGDTLIFHIGGCDHFSCTATLNTAIPLTDSVALFKRCLWVAENFVSAFDDKYATCISKGLFWREESYDKQLVHRFQINNPDTAVTNYVYDGFSFHKKGSRTRIEISEYMN